MEKKLDELTKSPTDPNSPESQKFLRELQKDIREHIDKMKRMIAEWQEEDRQNEIK